MARTTPSSTDTPAMVDLKAILSRSGETVEIPVSDLHGLDHHIENASSFLADFISRKMEEQGFESLDEANERSHDLSELLFLLSIVEDAGCVTAGHVERTLGSGRSC